MHDTCISPMVPVHLHGEIRSSLPSPSWHMRQKMPLLSPLRQLQGIKYLHLFDGSAL